MRLGTAPLAPCPPQLPTPPTDVRLLTGSNLLAALDPRTPLHTFDPLTAAVVRRARLTWAASTLRGRACLWDRFRTWSENHPHLSLDANLARFVESTQVSLSSRLTYAKALAAQASRLNETTPLLRLYMSGLARSGANKPARQARPMSKQDLDDLCRRWPQRSRHLPLLAWKTASRWSDLLDLRKSSFFWVSPTRVVVKWGDTKTTRGQVYMPTQLTVIDDLDPTRLLPLRQAIEALPQPESRLTGLATDGVNRMLKQLAPRYTAHSIKRGAIDHLMEHAATGALALQHIALLAKHAGALRGLPTTLRYADNPVSVALTLGTQHATVLL